MNLVLTISIFSGINYFQGKQIIKTTTVGIVEEKTLAYDAGFRTGDEIISINNNKIMDWQKIFTSLFIDESNLAKNVTVLRANNDTTFVISQDVLGKASQESFFLPIGNVKPYISSIVKDSPANDAGIKSGDIFLSLNNNALLGSAEVIKIISANANVQLPLTILRGEDTIKTAVTPGLDGKIGISIKDNYIGPIEHEQYSFFASVTFGFGDMVQYVVVTYEYMGRVLFGNLEMAQAFGGPVKIAQIAAETANLGIIPFLRLLAILSLSLAIMNILPFPVLDGGHFVIILLEGIFRREIPIKIKIAIQNAGFVILMILTAIILYNDIINL